ncbi:MAG: aldo/keto reductase [Phycisphaerae bacterium]
MGTPAALPLVLGTAQLGLRYGIANRAGKPNLEAATAIVREAWDGRIREFDTAQAYGCSEAVLGEALCRLGIADRAAVISKFDPALEHLDAAAMARAVEESLTRLGVASLAGMMLHRQERLAQWNQGLGRIAAALRATGKVKRIGVSVYSPDRAVEAIRADGIDMVQVPTSVLDGRFLDAGVFDLARERGKLVYVRSVFLQGLVLMGPAEIPDALAAVRPGVERLEALARDLDLTRQELALLAVRDAAPRARLIFGAETPAQVRDNLRAWARRSVPDLWQRAREAVGPVDERLLNPALWPL